MTTRRSLLATSLLATPLLATATFLPGGPAAAADPDSASAFVDAMLKELLAIANGPTALEAKRAALARVIEARVDVDGVARFCLGRFWRTATPAQQAEYLELFRRALVKNISDRVGEYQGVTYAMGRATRREADIAVATTVTRPGNAPNKVDWVIEPEGAPRVIDVIAEGTSLRLTQRSDYAAFLSRNANSIPALINALRQQAAG